MNKGFLAFLVLLRLAFMATGQECFVPGLCIGDLLGFEDTDNENECLEQCSDISSCQWWSYDSHDGFCGFYTTCDILDDITCPHCVSGEDDCRNYICDVPGQCVGTLIHEDYAPALPECQEKCANFPGCEWYTFDSIRELCLYFSTCPEISEDFCDTGCTSGENECGGFEDPETTTPHSGTTTNPTTDPITTRIDTTYPPTTYEPTTTSSGSCPSGWSQFEDSCYREVSTEYSWYDARDNCQSIGGYLAEIFSDEEKEFIEDLCPEDCWLGATDEFTEGTYYWDHSGSSLTYTNWYSDQPNGGFEENCLLQNLNGDHLWWDRPCYEGQASVCQRPL